MVLSIASLQSVAQKIVEVRDSVDQHIFTFSEISYFEDVSGEITFDEIVSDKLESHFLPNTVLNPTNTNRNSAYWYKIRVKHNRDSKREWIIEFFDQTIDRLEFYQPVDTGGYKSYVMGDLLKFEEREIWHKNFIIPVINDNNDVHTYYIRVKSQQRADVIVVLRARGWFFHYALDEYFFFGIFYGMILVFSFYNLLMFLAVREQHYLYYIFYLVSVGMYEMSADGIAFQYLWSQAPEFNYYAPTLFLYLATTAALVFSSSLLNLRAKYRSLFNLFIAVFAVRTLFLIMSFTMMPEWVRFRFIEVVPFLAIFYASARCYFSKRYQPARFLVIAYSFVAFGIIYKVTQYLNIRWSPLGELSHYSLGFSFIIEMLLLSFAISDKIRLLRLEKEEAQVKTIEQLQENQKLKDNLNRTLEDQVRLKTAELLQKSEHIEAQNHQLEEANRLLEAQAIEIAEINRLLERDNIQLQHDVAEVKEARVLSKEVDFEEFSAMHPNEESWLKFLSDVKWQAGYTCRKCGHLSYSPGRSPFSRRCTKCGYDESVTAYTLLQNTRLPISKALYMIFLVYNSKGNISSHKLSKVLSIRQSTCWSYSSRIKMVMKDRQKRGVRNSHEGWDSIILED